MRTSARLVVPTVLLLAAGCATEPRSRVSAFPLYVHDPESKEIVNRYDERARSSSDPVAVWIGALSEEKLEVVMAGLKRTRDSVDERLIQPLEEVVRRWRPKGHHDSVPVANYAAIDLDHLRGELAWKGLHLDKLSKQERLECLLQLARSKPSSEWLREKIFAEFLQSRDPRVVPFIVLFPREEAWDKIQSFGKDAVPALLDAAFKAEHPLVRSSALSCLSRLRAPEAVEPMIGAIRAIRTEDVLGKTPDRWNSDSLSSLKVALAGYGESVLDKLRAEVSAPDPMTRDSFLNVIAIIGGPKALEILKSALSGETSQDNSDGVNVRSRLLGYIERVEGEKK